MLLTLLLIGLVNSSCINRTFEECLSLNVEYQESCQLSKGECIKRPQNCNEIDATYPLNCRTSECYYSKKFQKCLSQPFTRLLEDDVAYRGFGGHRSGDGDRDQHRDGHRDSTQTQPQPMPPQPAPPMPPPSEPQEPQQPPTLPPSTNEEQNNENLDHEQDVVNENQNNDGEESKEDENDNNNQDSTDSEENGDESYEEQNNNENPNNNNENPNNNNENPKNDTQINNNTSVPTNNSTSEKPGFEGASKLEFLLQQEVKDQMQNSDVKQQIELSSWGIQLIVSVLIIWI